jgi:hypothetical protein
MPEGLQLRRLLALGSVAAAPITCPPAGGWRVKYRKHYYYNDTWGRSAFQAINDVRVHQWQAWRLSVKDILSRLIERLGLPDDVLLHFFTFVDAASPAPALLNVDDGDRMYGDLMKLADRSGGCAVLHRPPLTRANALVGSMEGTFLCGAL